MTTPDPFASDQDALNRPGPPIGLTSNAHCPSCDVKWKAQYTDEEWPCWVCGEDRRPPGVTPANAPVTIAGCVGIVMLQGEAAEQAEAWERAFAGYLGDE